MIATIAMMLLTGVSASLTQLLDYFWKDDQTNRHKGARIALLTLTVLATAGGIVAVVINESGNEREKEALRDDLAAIKAAQNDLIGGDSYPRLSLQPMDRDGRIRLAAHGIGSSNLMGVQAEILDFNSLEAMSKPKLIDIGIVSHEYPKLIEPFFSAPATPGTRSYKALLYAQNGMFTEDIRIRTVATEAGLLCVYDLVVITKQERFAIDGGYGFNHRFLERPTAWRSHAMPGSCPPLGLSD